MAERNRTLTLNDKDIALLEDRLCVLQSPVSSDALKEKILCQDMLEAAKFLPHAFVDLLFLDPPYNLNKSFNGTAFKKRKASDYNQILDEWIKAILHTLKPDASIYICGDWHTSTSIHEVASQYFNVRNRITWEREKGRGAMSNWKIVPKIFGFALCPMSISFNAEAVKLKRKVIAPYRNGDGTTKDWEETDNGNYRLTSPSNLWTDITVPFWSMPENTDHPTQKPEKLLAKLILASSKSGDVVFDPFLGLWHDCGNGKETRRNYLGIEQERKYAFYALHRLAIADKNKDIQGYSDGVFWERNSLAEQKKSSEKSGKSSVSSPMFDLLGGHRMRESIFHNSDHEVIEERIQKYLNGNQDFLSPRTLQSTRAAGDALQDIMGDKFHEFAAEYCQEYSNDFARRSMADLAFTDKFGNYHVVDVKTHREDTKFNMPNLTSVERLSRFYEDDKNYFSLLIIKYRIEETLLKVTDVTFKPVPRQDKLDK